MKSNKFLLLCIIALYLVSSTILTSCNKEVDLPQPVVENQVGPETPPDNTPVIPPEPTVVLATELETTTGNMNALAMVFAGKYAGTCDYVQSNFQTGGPVTSTGSRSIEVNYIPGSNAITLGGPSVYNHISGVNPLTEVIRYKSDAYYPAVLAFDLPNNRLDYSWGASSPGGYANENCELYR